MAATCTRMESTSASVDIPALRIDSARSRSLSADRSACCADLRTSEAAVVKRLRDLHLRLKIIQSIRPIERSDLEVLLAELVLRQQRAEYKDWVVTTLPRFGVINFRELATFDGAD